MKKGLAMLGTSILAFSLLTACVNNNDDNIPGDNEAPLNQQDDNRDIQNNDKNNGDENLNRDENNLERDMNDNDRNNGLDNDMGDLNRDNRDNQ